MLRQSDIVINVLPLAAATHGILYHSLFRHFRKGAYLFAMVRGGHVVEADLLQALAEEYIAGALHGPAMGGDRAPRRRYGAVPAGWVLAPE